jgi:hypothetical protein
VYAWCCRLQSWRTRVLGLSLGVGEGRAMMNPS